MTTEELQAEVNRLKVENAALQGEIRGLKIGALWLMENSKGEAVSEIIVPQCDPPRGYE